MSAPSACRRHHVPPRDVPPRAAATLRERYERLSLFSPTFLRCSENHGSTTYSLRYVCLMSQQHRVRPNGARMQKQTNTIHHDTAQAKKLSDSRRAVRRVRAQTGAAGVKKRRQRAPRFCYIAARRNQGSIRQLPAMFDPTPCLFCRCLSRDAHCHSPYRLSPDMSDAAHTMSTNKTDPDARGARQKIAVQMRAQPPMRRRCGER